MDYLGGANSAFQELENGRRKGVVHGAGSLQEEGQHRWVPDAVQLPVGGAARGDLDARLELLHEADQRVVGEAAHLAAFQRVLDRLHNKPF